MTDTHTEEVNVPEEASAPVSMLADISCSMMITDAVTGDTSLSPYVGLSYTQHILSNNLTYVTMQLLNLGDSTDYAPLFKSILWEQGSIGAYKGSITSVDNKGNVNSMEIEIDSDGNPTGYLLFEFLNGSSTAEYRFVFSNHCVNYAS